HRLAGPRLRLLRQVADLAPADHLPAVGRLQPREDAEEGRLADPVRADDADAVARRDDQRDAVEHLDGGVGLGNVTCTERARHGLTSFDRKGERRGFGLEISHGAARSRAVGNPSYHERPLWLYPRGKPPRLV